MDGRLGRGKIPEDVRERLDALDDDREAKKRVRIRRDEVFVEIEADTTPYRDSLRELGERFQRASKQVGATGHPGERMQRLVKELGL